MSMIDRPARIGKYQILEELGRGAFGVVLHARDPFVERDVAIKVARAPDQGMPPKAADFEHAFFVEARAAGRLQHQNIVSVFDAGIDAGTNYIVMEYVEGHTLLAYADIDPAPERIVEIAFDCAKALDYAHRANVLHRDIKPENIMVRRDGMTKLMDFGIAAVMQNRTVRQDKVVGTPSFMAPEQVGGEDIGPATDLYGLGAVIYRLLAGQPPHVAETQRRLIDLIRTTDPTPLQYVRPDLPDKLCLLVNRLLERDPAQRYQSGHELAMDLLGIFDRRASTLRRKPHEAERAALAALGFCRDMTPAEIDELLAAGRIRRVVAGERILHDGEANDNLYLIVLGSVTVGGGLPMTLSQGEVFGSLALPAANAMASRVVAREDGLLLEVPRSGLDDCSELCRLRVYQACCSALLYRVSLLSALAAG